MAKTIGSDLRVEERGNRHPLRDVSLPQRDPWLEVDSIRHRAARAGDEIKLTPKEFELLSFLARHAGRVVTHKQILTAVWGPAHTEDTQYLRVYVGQLRQKIEEHADDPRIILTEPGIGYRITEC
jgi:two-component system KDP operon response regulator KdpE